MFISYRKAFTAHGRAVVRYKRALTAQHRLFVNYKRILPNQSSQKEKNHIKLGQFFPKVVIACPIRGNELFETEVKCPYDSRKIVVGDQMAVMSKEKSHFHSKETSQGLTFI